MSTAKKLDSLEVSAQSMDELQEISYSKRFTKEFNKRNQDEK